MFQRLVFIVLTSSRNEATDTSENRFGSRKMLKSKIRFIKLGRVRNEYRYVVRQF